MIRELSCFSHYYSILPEFTVLYTASIWDLFFLLPHHFSLACCLSITQPRYDLYLNHTTATDCKLQLSVGWVLWFDCLRLFLWFWRHGVSQKRRWGKEKKAGNLGITQEQFWMTAIFQAQEAFCILVGKGYQVSYIVFCCVLLATAAQLN